MRKAMMVLAVGALSMLSLDVMACGESLFRVGKGKTFREYTTPLPGNILVVARSPGELAMVQRLAAAGHHVHIVADPTHVASVLEEDQFDIVLSRYADRGVVNAQLDGSSVTLIPVASDAEEKQASAEYKYALSEEDNVKTFLRTIHKSLKKKLS